MRKPNSPAQTNWGLLSSNEHTAPQAGATRDTGAEAVLDLDIEDRVPLCAQNTLPASGWTLGLILSVLESKRHFTCSPHQVQLPLPAVREALQQQKWCRTEGWVTWCPEGGQWGF